MKTYYQKFLNQLCESSGEKILLHSCCGPCSSYVIMLLKDYFDITVIYYNPNIMPVEEYVKRKKEQVRILKILNIKHLDCDYENEKYLNDLKDITYVKEGLSRCYACYKYRMEYTVKKAKELDFDCFTTTLSVSPYKKSRYINEIGELLEREYHVKFIYSDFKKKDGYKKSVEISKKYNLYRQHYCGCIYSLEQSLQDIENSIE